MKAIGDPKMYFLSACFLLCAVNENPRIWCIQTSERGLLFIPFFLLNFGSVYVHLYDLKGRGVFVKRILMTCSSHMIYETRVYIWELYEV